MAERGGLNYPIRVRDDFSKVTQSFRSEISASKKSFRDFQKAVKGSKSTVAGIRNQAKATKDLAAAQKQLASATKKAVKPMTEEERAAKALEIANRKLAKSIAEQARLQRQRERTAVALRNAQNADLKRQQALERAKVRQAAADKKAAQAKNADFQATKKVTAELFRQKVVLKQIQQLKLAAATQRAGGDIIGSQATLRRAKQLEKSLVGSQKAATSMLFTFRRLVGTLAIFTLARKGVQAFNELVTEGIKFNDTIEISQLGIAGLVATLGDVRDAQGQSVSKTEELNLALGIAREQTAKLRQDSLKTVATFGELLETFQVSVGPGLAAGLNLDEVRQLTVDISQAAAALGVPQNQLAEEVRSLLSGTIQARTTRIATALGISNEDVRRLKETGELFNFLEEEFSGFAESAQRQARETFSGISTLIKGIVQEVLGNAARPLFKELLDLGNDLFDNLLSVKDAAGNIKPNPAVVSAFQSVFDALKNGVVAARELASQIGVGGLQSALGAAGVALDVIVGAIGVVVGLVGDALSIVTAFREQLGLTSDQTSNVGQEVGKWGARLILANLLMSKLNAKMLAAVKGPAILVAAFAAMAKGIEFILEKMFDVNLNIRETVELISLGLLGAWFEVGAAISKIAEGVSFAFGGALDFVISKAKSSALKALGFIQSELLFDDEAAQGFKDRAFAEEQSLKKTELARGKAHKLEIDRIRLESDAKQKAIQDEIAAITSGAAARGAKGAGFDPGFDPGKAAQDAANAAKTFVSTADKPIGELGESLAKVNTEIRKAQLEFEQASVAARGGVGGGISSAFDKEAIANAERLRKIRSSLADTEREIARLREAGVGEGEGALVTALRDEKDLRDAINISEETSLKLAGLRAAAQAKRILPGLREESTSMAAQVAAERAKTQAIVRGAGSREMALIAAQTAVELAEAELQATKDKNASNLKDLRDQAAKLPPGAELDSINAVISALAVRQGYEEEILRLRTEQLKKAEEEAELVANGSLTEGLREGFNQFAEQFGSTFQAGINIAKEGIQALSQFGTQAIVDMFDPTKSSEDIKASYAKIMQQIASIILQNLLQVAIAKGIKELGFATTKASVDAAGATAEGVIRIATANTVAGIMITAAQTVAAIRAASGGGFNKGGLVPRGYAQGGMIAHATKAAQPFAAGGFSKPSHIPASDTIPAWLTPGEFVLRKSAVDSFGLPLLQAMNGGNMSVLGSRSAEVSGPSAGMASGGLVSDQLTNSNNDTESSENKTVVVPAIVARDRELDTLTAGGKNAMLSFMQDNAGDISEILDRSNR